MACSGMPREKQDSYPANPVNAGFPSIMVRFLTHQTIANGGLRRVPVVRH